MDDIRLVAEEVFDELGVCPECHGTLDLVETGKDFRAVECTTCHVRIGVTTRHNMHVIVASRLSLIVAALVVGFVMGIVI